LQYEFYKDSDVMLPARLLKILRVDCPLARRLVVPGREESQLIDVQILCSACRSAGKATRLTKWRTVHALHVHAAFGGK
jgi:hypothetical protein